MNFAKINSIDLKDDKTFKNKIFLTFDLDWCNDEVLENTLNLIEINNLKATLFFTHKTSLLDRVNKNKNIEIGIHPNFNNLLNNLLNDKNIYEVIKLYKNIFPKAKSVRSHSLVNSLRITEAFVKFGFKYECNNFIPYTSNIKLAPYKIKKEKIIHVPFCWQDDIALKNGWIFNLEKLFDFKGIKVFNFHPIHLFLNCENMYRYEKNRKYFHNIRLLKKKINKGYGVNNFFCDLIKKLK